MRKLLIVAMAALACSKSGGPSHHEDRHQAAIAAPRLELVVTVDGVPTTWHADVFDRVPRIAGKASDGKDRDTWSLRDLVHQLVGPTARVVAVSGDTTASLDAVAWNDVTRTPILHTTRRGALKFRWADRDGKWGETVVKDVAKLEVAR